MRGGIVIFFAIGLVLSYRSFETPSEEKTGLSKNYILFHQLEEVASNAHRLPQARELLLRLQSMRMQNHRYFQILKGEMDASAEQREDAFHAVEQLILAFKASLDWKPSSPYPVARRNGEIVIDGFCGDEAWKHAKSALLNYKIDTIQPVDMACAEARLLWDEQYLYAAFEVPDTSIIAPSQEKDEDLFLNDCIELFLMPLKRYGYYWELNINPHGIIMDQFCTKHQDAPLSCFQRNLNIEGLRSATQLLRETDGKVIGYSVEIAIPLDQLPGFIPRDGASLWILMARGNRDTMEGSLEFYSHAPMIGTFHNIWTLPEAIFSN